MENHLGEIWSLFHFLMPGFLGSQQRFVSCFATPWKNRATPDGWPNWRPRRTVHAAPHQGAGGV